MPAWAQVPPCMIFRPFFIGSSLLVRAKWAQVRLHGHKFPDAWFAGHFHRVPLTGLSQNSAIPPSWGQVPLHGHKFPHASRSSLFRRVLPTGLGHKIPHLYPSWAQVPPCMIFRPFSQGYPYPFLPRLHKSSLMSTSSPAWAQVTPSFIFQPFS